MTASGITLLPAPWRPMLLAMLLSGAAGACIAYLENPEEHSYFRIACGILTGIVSTLIASFFFTQHEKMPANPLEQDLPDPLTGLYGQVRLWETLEIECVRAKRLGRMVGIVAVELPDEHPGAVSRRVVSKSVARTLRTILRPYDSAYYLGSGRFALLLGSTTEDGGKAVVVRVQDAVHATPTLAGISIRIGCSVVDPAAEGESQSHRVLELALQHMKASQQTPEQASATPAVPASPSSEEGSSGKTPAEFQEPLTQ